MYRAVSDYPEHKLYSAVWEMWVSGTELSGDKKDCVVDISITETVNGSDTATITLVDPNFKFIEDNIFYEDNPIKIKLGWQDDTYRIIFTGYISAIDMQFGEDGIPNLSIFCLDDTHKMNLTENTKEWKNTTSNAVVETLVRNYGFKFEGESGYDFKVQDTISQNNQTDIAFIQQLAKNEVYPFTARLVGKTFYYQKKGKLTEPVMELSYREYPYDIISFSPQVNKETTKSGTSSGSTNTSKGTGEAATIETPTPSIGGEGTSSSDSSSGGGGSSNGRTHTYNPVTGTWS